jgi:acetolactate synthase-1/3 small subunit
MPGGLPAAIGAQVANPGKLVVDISRCRVIDVGAEYYTVELTGDEDKISAFLNLIKPMGIKEIARTGALALGREKK